ncbi:MAG: hypothetical protein HY056_16990, partial [Proteobacteria bacterium]|nr:hypothetical protein [Pseudomonadota bacterium]
MRIVAVAIVAVTLTVAARGEQAQGFREGSGAAPAPDLSLHQHLMGGSVSDADAHVQDASRPHADGAEINLGLLDWAALRDTTASTTARAGAYRSRPGSAGAAAGWTRSQKSDGSQSISVSRKIPLAWPARFGADLDLAGEPDGPQRGLPPITPHAEDRARQLGGSGAAWATISGSPLGIGRAAFEARVKSVEEKGTIAATIGGAVPIGGQASIALENRYSLTQSLAAAAPLPANATQAFPEAPTSSAQNWETQPTARLDLPATGTSLSTGATRSSNDGHWVARLAAEQKVLDHLRLTGALTAKADGGVAKSVGARYKLSW